MSSSTSCIFDIFGGGGGGGSINFASGFVFIRDDTQDVYVADQTDYGNVGQLTTNGGNRHPSLSADGRQAVFAHVDTASVWSLMTVATSGGGAARTVYTADAVAGQKNFKNPVFSADAAVIVFAFEVGTTSRIAKVNAADGSGFTELTSGLTSFASPAFYPAAIFPDTVLVISGNTIGDYTQLQRININTMQALSATNNLGGEAASIAERAVLSPDGTKVAFDGKLASASSTTRIFVQTLGTGATLRITDATSGNHSFPTWASTTTVGFVSNEGGANQVYIQPDSTTDTGQLTIPSANQPWFGPI